MSPAADDPALVADVTAIRTAVALTDGAHIVAARVVGPAAHDLVDRVSPRELFVRTGQMLQTVLLDDDARPIADAYVACDEDDYLIVAEGLDGPALAAYLRGHADGDGAEVIDLSASHGFLCLDGPYAWELLADVTSPDVIGLPYLGFFHEGRFTCLRGGKTGEYGYDLMVERARLPALRAQLLAAGARFDLRVVSLAALELCALESGFFNVRREVRPGLTPIELQLQWRVSAGRSFPGAAALAARRRAPGRRLTMIVADAELPIDAALALDGADVGSVLHVGRSITLSGTRDAWVGVALIDRPIAHPGLEGFGARAADGAWVAVRTMSAPLVNNLSLYVDPQRHGYATRADDSFPPLVRPRWP